MSNPRFVAGALLAAIAILIFQGQCGAVDNEAGKPGIYTLPVSAKPPSSDPHIDYQTGTSDGFPFFISVPPQYDGIEPYGLLVFDSPEDQLSDLPPGWQDVLSRHNMIFIAPEGAGNDIDESKRLGLCVHAALAAQHYWRIDPHRIYIGGFSGGARMAGTLGFLASDIFTGSIQICGADFYKQVPQVQGKPLPQDTTPYGTGLTIATPAEIAAAKKSFGFVFITGQNDFRHGQILDIVNGGYAKEGFHCKLIDVPAMGHEICQAGKLSAALDFLENVKPAATPTPPAWMAKDPKDWPQMVLENRLTYSDGGVGYAGSSELFRLPNGVVVMATAGHVLGDMKPADFHKDLRSWITFSPTAPDGGVFMTQVAMDTSQPPPVDAFVLCPDFQDQRWPALVLPVRTEPLEIGDTVYLLAVPNNSKSRQNVYKGLIVALAQGSEFEYIVDGDFDTNGFSGAPVIDQYGRLAAIHTAHSLTQNIPGKKDLFCLDITAIVKAIKLPANVRPVHVASADQTGGASSAAASPDALSQKADEALRNLQPYLDNNLYDLARPKLEEIIERYPGTDAAKKAKQILASFPPPASDGQ